MGIAGGVFWGYREFEILPKGRQKLRAPVAMLAPPKTTALEIEQMKTPTFDYDVFSGLAPDDYPDELIQIRFLTRMVIISIEHAPIEIRFSFDGETITDERILRHSHRTMHGIKAFQVRNALPGWKAWYQLVAFV